MNHDDNGNDRVADRFKHDDGPGGHNSAVFGQVGTGKTRQISTKLMHRLVDDIEGGEFVDPKGEDEDG